MASSQYIASQESVAREGLKQACVRRGRSEGAASTALDIRRDFQAFGKGDDGAEIFLNAHYGVPKERRSRESGIKRTFLLNILIPSGFALGVAYLFFFLFAHYAPGRHANTINRKRQVTWPTLPLTVILSTLGGALSFLLVFSLGWSFSYWRQGRQLMGSTAMNLKQLWVLLRTSSTLDASELATACEWFMANVAIDIMPAKDNTEETRAFKSKSSQYVLHAHLELAKLIHASEKGQSTTVIKQAWGHHATLLANHAGMRRLNDGCSPKTIEVLASVLCYFYTVIIYPIFIAYIFAMKLSDESQRENNILWNANGIFHAFFVVSILLAVLYFNTLHWIGKELEDPFGDDISDIKIRPQYVDPFFADLDKLRALDDAAAEPASPKQ